MCPASCLQSGTLHWPRLCAGQQGDGPPAPHTLSQVNATIAPFWLADSTNTLAVALDGWAAYVKQVTPLVSVTVGCR